MCYPKKFKLGHQTISPHERVGPGDETRWYKRYMCCLGIDPPNQYFKNSTAYKQYNLASVQIIRKKQTELVYAWLMYALW